MASVHTPDDVAGKPANAVDLLLQSEVVAVGVPRSHARVRHTEIGNTFEIIERGGCLVHSMNLKVRPGGSAVLASLRLDLLDQTLERGKIRVGGEPAVANPSRARKRGL